MTSIDAGMPLKSDSAWHAHARAILAWFGAALIAFLLGGVLVLIAGGSLLGSLRAMFDGGLGSVFAAGQLLVLAIPLIIIGLGLAIAFRGRVYNIGAEGQFFMGALAGGVLLLTLHADGRLAVGLALAAGVVGGACWGAIVGLLRARWSVNEVISSLLLTYVALFIFSWAIRRPLSDPLSGNKLASRSVPDSTLLPVIPDLFVHYGIFVALALVPIVGYLLGRTPFGFRVRAMGWNPDATEAAGVRTGRLVVALMCISGGLAGLAGIIQVVGISGRLDAGLSQNYGYTAIVVALLGRLRAVGVLLAALFVAFLNVGGQAMSVDEGLPYSIVLAIQGVFVVTVLIADRFSRA